MTLDCCTYFGSVDHEWLMHRATLFSRVVKFRADQSGWWTEERMLQLPSLPYMQHVTKLDLSTSSAWANHPLVQTALLGLPRLKSFRLAVGPDAKLLPSAFATASTLSTLKVEVYTDQSPDRWLHALRAARKLASLSVGFLASGWSLPEDLVWCLPPNLTQLDLLNVDMGRREDLSRPMLKALFSRTPHLARVRLSAVSTAEILRGFVDAGAAALPALRHVDFADMQQHHFSGYARDPLERIFRRFVQRFPRVTVRIEFVNDAWDHPEELLTVQLCYAGWSSVEMYSSDTGERVGGPMIPHPSDEDNSIDAEVEE